MNTIDGSNIGTCRVCKNKAEIGADYMCSDCSSNEFYVSKEGESFSEPSGDTNTIPQKSGTSKRDKYLEYIIERATVEWIDKFLEEWKFDMRRSFAWVGELRKETDDLILLRRAAELGFGKLPKLQEPKQIVQFEYIEDHKKIEKALNAKPPTARKTSSRATKQKKS